jgi:glucokinase
VTERLLLAGDIGGTKTNLGLFGAADSGPCLKAWESYASRDAEGLEDLIDRFLHTYPAPVSVACFGIAGPVHRGMSKTTNLPWTVSEETIRHRFHWDRVTLINDLSATAYAVPYLQGPDIRELNAGQPDPDGSIGIVAPGTGLGMALAVTICGKLHPVPSEGGHVEFAPRNELEIRFLQHLFHDMSHVSVERVLSGPGLVTIYLWMEDHTARTAPLWLADRLGTEDPARVVSEAALVERDPVCVAALDLFVSLLGSVAGNLALTGMTTAGMWLGGGICPKILPKLEEPLFMEAFSAKGRFKGLLRDIPVRVILNDKAGLLGAACKAWHG